MLFAADPAAPPPPKLPPPPPPRPEDSAEFAEEIAEIRKDMAVPPAPTAGAASAFRSKVDEDSSRVVEGRSKDVEDSSDDDGFCLLEENPEVDPDVISGVGCAVEMSQESCVLEMNNDGCILEENGDGDGQAAGGGRGADDGCVLEENTSDGGSGDSGGCVLEENESEEVSDGSGCVLEEN